MPNRPVPGRLRRPSRRELERQIVRRTAERLVATAQARSSRAGARPHGSDGVGGHRLPGGVLLCGPENVRIGLKISLCLLGIAVLVGLVGWRSTVANDAVRGQVEHLRRNSIQELMGAVDMLIALKETQLAARELVSASWNERFAHRGSQAQQRGPSGRSKAIETGLSTFEEQLEASRRATEGALAMAEQAGDVQGAER